MLHLSPSCTYYLFNTFTDMRKGFDSLGGLVRTEMNRDPLCQSVFIFFNKKHNQVKLLLWEGDGFALYYKRLEKGTYEVPVANDKKSSVSISSEQLQFILQGISLKSIRKRKRYQQIMEISG